VGLHKQHANRTGDSTTDRLFAKRQQNQGREGGIDA
jgi:hypothetical protein